MKRSKLKLGVVELVLDVSNIKDGHRFGAAAKAAQRDKKREQTVQAALADAKKAGCGLILFPGWTLLGDSIPPWLIQESADCTVIVELERKKAEKKGVKPISNNGRMSSSQAATVHGTYILHNGTIVAGPIPQHFGNGKQVETRSSISKQAQALVDELNQKAGASRHWDHPIIGRITILVCGEIMLVGGGGGLKDGGSSPCFHRQSLQKAGLPANWHRQTRLFLNPSHVTGMPQSVRDKRAWLADGSMLLATANLSQGTWVKIDPDDGSHRRTTRSAHTAAEAYWQKKRRPDLLHNQTSLPPYRLCTIAI